MSHLYAAEFWWKKFVLGDPECRGAKALFCISHRDGIKALYWACNNLAKINTSRLYFVQVGNCPVESGCDLWEGRRWPATEAEEDTFNAEATSSAFSEVPKQS